MPIESFKPRCVRLSVLTAALQAARDIPLQDIGREAFRS